jgi:hypothetical protein
MPSPKLVFRAEPQAHFLQSGHTIKQLQHPGRVWSSKSSERIPAGNSFETVGAAAGVATFESISECTSDRERRGRVVTYLG